MKRVAQKHIALPSYILFLGCIVCVFSLSMNIAFLIHEYRSLIVVAVPDGDSLDLADGRRIRLLGIDAPEMGRCMADKSRARLSQLILGKRVRMKHIVNDEYGRQLADVVNDNHWDGVRHAIEFFKRALGLPHQTPLSKNMLNRVMVEEGLALYSGSNTEYKEILRAASEKAKTEKLGIYSPECLQTVPPDTHCAIKGNVRNGAKIYHLPGCDNYDQTEISLSFGDAWFCDEASALSAGFKKAGGCRE